MKKRKGGDEWEMKWDILSKLVSLSYKINEAKQNKMKQNKIK